MHGGESELDDYRDMLFIDCYRVSCFYFIDFIWLIIGIIMIGQVKRGMNE